MGHTGLVAALCAFQQEVAPIHKDSTGQHSKYASLQAVLVAISPALSGAGLAITQTFATDIAGRALLRTTLRHVSGESETSVAPLITPDGRNPLHVWGGAVTYQRRYAILAILNLAAGIDDDDGDIAGSKVIKLTSRAADDFI